MMPACGSANIPDCLFSALRYALARLSHRCSSAGLRWASNPLLRNQLILSDKCWRPTMTASPGSVTSLRQLAVLRCLAASLRYRAFPQHGSLVGGHGRLGWQRYQLAPAGIKLRTRGPVLPSTNARAAADDACPSSHSTSRCKVLRRALSVRRKAGIEDRSRCWRSTKASFASVALWPGSSGWVSRDGGHMSARRDTWTCYAGFPPQTAKRWPGFRHKPRNQNLCGEIRLKQACGRVLIGKTVSQAPDWCAGACRIKGNGHDRCPGYRTCHCCDGNTGNYHGGGARLKAGILLVAAQLSLSERPVSQPSTGSIRARPMSSKARCDDPRPQGAPDGLNGGLRSSWAGSPVESQRSGHFRRAENAAFPRDPARFAHNDLVRGSSPSSPTTQFTVCGEFLAVFAKAPNWRENPVSRQRRPQSAETRFEWAAIAPEARACGAGGTIRQAGRRGGLLPCHAEGVLRSPPWRGRARGRRARSSCWPCGRCSRRTSRCLPHSPWGPRWAHWASGARGQSMIWGGRGSRTVSRGHLEGARIRARLSHGAVWVASCATAPLAYCGFATVWRRYLLRWSVRSPTDLTGPRS